MLRLSETTDTIRDVNNPSISKPLYASRGETQSSEKVQRLIIGLRLQKHPEGGYFKKGDQSTF